MFAYYLCKYGKGKKLIPIACIELDKHLKDVFGVQYKKLKVQFHSLMVVVKVK